MIGKKVSHYRIVEKIGEGGMGEVYLAEDEKLLRKVALKFLAKELTRDEPRRRRFVQEARAAAGIEHPHIAAVHDIDEADGRTFIAMEYVRGRNLRDFIPEGGLGLRRTVDLAIQIAEGLTKAHDHGVVHRDIKPENVIVSEDGYPKIIDFGLAKLLEPLTREIGQGTAGPTQTRLETREGLVLGTVAYMSPEQARAEEIDARSDIFSFGVLLYEMLTAVSPFRRGSAIESLNAVIKEVPAPPSERGVQTPKELERILRKALAKDKSERYQSMKDLVLDLRELRDELVSGGHEAPQTTTHPTGRRLWPVAAAAALAFVAFVSVFLISRDSSPAGIGASGRPAVAVLYFENNTGDEQIRWLSQGLPSMLLTDLAQTPGLDVVSSQRVHEILKQIGQDNTETIDKGIAAEVARRSGAGAVVVGSIFKSGEEIRIDVQVEDVGTGRILSAESVRGTDVFPMVDDLTRRIRTGLRLTDAPPTPPLTDVSTASLEAYRLYAEALDARRNVRYADARALLEKAIALDPSFAMAHFELALIARVYGQPALEEDHMARVLENLNRLPERERALVQAREVRLKGGDTAKALELLESLVDKYPDEEDAYFEIAAIRRQQGRADGALTALARAVKAIPQSGSLHNDYGYDLLRSGRYQNALSEFEAYARIRPDEPNPYDSMGEVRLILGDAEEALKSYGRALEVDPNFGNSHGGRAWAYAMMGRYDEALAEVELLRDRAVRLGIPLTLWHFMQAFALSRVGRYQESEEELRKAGDLAEELGDDVTGTGVHALEAVVRLERDDLDGAIAAARRAEASSQAVKIPALREAQSRITRSLEGIALARSGRLEEARRTLDELRDYREDLPERWFRFALAGEIALKEGRLDDAEQAYASGTSNKIWFNLGTPPPTVLVQHAPFRDGLARIRKARGDWKGAIEAYRALNTPGRDNPWTSWLEPRFVLATARILREHGETEAARTDYRRFLELWKDADPELPEIREAKELLGQGRR